jgi:small subunit ribosomal protein S6
MQSYEINYLVLQSKTAQLEKIRESMKNFLVSNGAEIVEEKEYLKRKLAYEVKHEGYGFFTVLRFKLEEGSKLAEMKKNISLNSDIARNILVKADHLPSLDLKPQEQQRRTETEETSRGETIKAQDVEKMISQNVQKAKSEESAKNVEKELKEEPVVAQDNDKEESEETKDKQEPRKDEPSSLEDLDKKLDEILNI